MKTDRRTFLTGAAFAAAPMFIPQSAFGANDRITYGLMGAGGRGRYLNREFQKLGAQCVALSEVYEPNLEMARKESPEGIKSYSNYRELLQQPGIDTVVIASPDHHHMPMLLASLEADKDVYIEKPISHNLAESDRIVVAVQKSGKVVQVGMQRRSAPSVVKAKKVIDDGILGRICMVKPQWNWNVAKPLDNSPLPGKLDWASFLGGAKDRPVEPMRFRNWRYFWDYAGGNMTDQGTHLMDVVQWFTKNGPPKSAIMNGQVAKMTGAEHPDVFCAVFEYPEMLVTWTLNYTNAFQNGWSIQFQGDKGTMILDDAGYKVWAEPWKATAAPIIEEKAPVPLEPHIQNFLDCVKSRLEPNCPVYVATQAVAGPHLANQAFLQGKKVMFS
jgi:predicted dehydrogenase